MTEPAHGRRDRAESFGKVAADYDRYRPTYPDALIDDLLASRPRRVLDVGCGTGKATRLFAARGADVLGVEIDPQMAAVARGHGLDVEVAGFEDWDDAGRSFDLIVSAQAWHWVDPAVGIPTAARLLAPGGELAVFWNIDELAPEERAIVRAVEAEFAPELDTSGGAGTDQAHLRRLVESGWFAEVRATTYEADRTWTVAEWVGNVGTHSNHLLLGERLPALLDALTVRLSERGPHVRTIGGTYAIRARLA